MRPPMSETMENSSSPEPLERKRKRDSTNAPELEIDVSLPEPPSKKALRKAKKSQSESVSQEAPRDFSNGVTGDGDRRLEKDESVAVAKSESKSNKRSGFGIWIGNLPWSMDRQGLKSFFTSNSAIVDEQITRIHMPAPANPVATKTQLKPQNKGFAYVDFDTQEVMESAIALSETPIGGRNVLIKNAKSFEGRPEAKDSSHADRKDAELKRNPPAKKIFVGNLGFDVTKDDLKDHFQKCGDLEDIHMATFEDTGKCKGYAWIVFTELEGAEAAVRGWVMLTPQNDEIDDEPENQSSDQARPNRAGSKKPRGRKWFVNRLAGRSLRCEFAEDSTVRYKKRFGKDLSHPKTSNGVDDGHEDGIVEELDNGNYHAKKKTKDHSQIAPGAPTDATKRRGKAGFESDSKPTNYNRKNTAMEESRYRTGVITGGTGTKVTFG